MNNSRRKRRSFLPSHLEFRSNGSTDLFSRQTLSKHRQSDRVFQEGEMVLLKLQPYVQSSIVNRPCPKLAYKYFGPFKVLEKVGSVAYRLELPENSLVHPVFHVSQLKAFTPNDVPVFSDFSQMVDLSQVDVKPLYIVDR
jgi:hypothetical protein